MNISTAQNSISEVFIFIIQLPNGSGGDRRGASLRVLIHRPCYTSLSAG